VSLTKTRTPLCGQATRHRVSRGVLRPEILAYARAAYPQHRSSNATRVSKARIRLDSRKSVRSFKEIICVDISEFESSLSGRVGVKHFQTAPSILVSMPSQGPASVSVTEERAC
jgi:hypothetical protein